MAISFSSIFLFFKPDISAINVGGYSLRERIFLHLRRKKLRLFNLFKRSVVKYYIVFPTEGFDQKQNLSICAHYFIGVACDHFHRLTGEIIHPLWFECSNREMGYLQGGHLFTLRELSNKEIHIFINPSFLLSELPPVNNLLKSIKNYSYVFCGQKSSRELHAIAFSASFISLTSSESFFWSSIKCLASCVDDHADVFMREIDHNELLDTSEYCIDNSPSMALLQNPASKRWIASACYLNTAFREIISNPQSSSAKVNAQETIKSTLLEHRKNSLVPFIFNSWINEIEFRVGSIKPQSFPTEIHLSVTGKCNIECRFCSYTHEIGRLDSVTPEQFSNMDFLKYIQTIRLNSGLGEPTINKDFAKIIDIITSKHPHIAINFFTDGLALNRRGLIESIVGQVQWVNISINAATRESWKEQCNLDKFQKLLSNIKMLYEAKCNANSLLPIMHGSMVLNRANFKDLPLMPALCRQLGIDRFTAFPFNGLGYGDAEKFGPDMALETFREEYDALYQITIDAAKHYRVSIELPPPSDLKRIKFGTEVRSFYDFARIETNNWSVGKFLSDLKFHDPEGSFCHFLWRQGAIGSTNNAGHSKNNTHYMYPCIGPLSSVDLSRTTAFKFSSAEGFMELWQGELFSFLRESQHQKGKCAVCDFCRNHDARDPEMFPVLEELVAKFSDEYSNTSSNYTNRR